MQQMPPEQTLFLQKALCSGVHAAPIRSPHKKPPLSLGMPQSIETEQQYSLLLHGMPTRFVQATQTPPSHAVSEQQDTPSGSHRSPGATHWGAGGPAGASPPSESSPLAHAKADSTSTTTTRTCTAPTPPESCRVHTTRAPRTSRAGCSPRRHVPATFSASFGSDAPPGAVRWKALRRTSRLGRLCLRRTTIGVLFLPSRDQETPQFATVDNRSDIHSKFLQLFQSLDS